MPSYVFAPPGDTLRLTSEDPRLFALADRLWERRTAGTEAASAIRIGIRVDESPSEVPGRDPERDLRWEHGPEAYVTTIGGLLSVRIGLGDATVEGVVAESLLRFAPVIAARFLLEAPAAVLLSRRGFSVLHAGAIVGRRGVAVIRGAAGAGKSTLTGAAWRAGFGVLADESLLVSRADPDDLAAAVRDLTLRPDAAALLGVEGEAETATSGGEEKRRIDLFSTSTPAERRGRRTATFLLGPRSPGPARLVPLEGEPFVTAFREGEIPQERLGFDPAEIARRWAGHSTWRLDGAEDLHGALDILRLILD
jgi:hypothetical protein